MKALVTGGGGYLGGAIVRALLARGDNVVSLQRGSYPWLEQAGARTYTGDINDIDTLLRASAGCDAVFHVAGKTGVWGDYQEYHQTNVAGTACVIHACLKNHIPHLIHTSSPSVVFAGRDEAGINETTPYPEHYYNHYQRTKALAEQKVLMANSRQLATVALRPHLIWGPGDPHLIGRILKRATSGRLRLVKGENLVDTTYIDNAAAAHLQAADALQVGATCAGKAYFISNGEPRVLHELINAILAAYRLPPVTKTITPALAYTLGVLSEFVYTLGRIKREPLMTRFVAKQLSCTHWYDISAARRDFGYTPTISIAEGLRRLKPA
ncbi:MAG: 3-beta-hydroxysteroid dehydrogenase/isomerase family protein [Gammaproteobacteria bacterium]|nr:3-beta-hydroxysteroid dehydrogenase/isomerase family protein [Gammaproteobacteria bacterium]